MDFEIYQDPFTTVGGSPNLIPAYLLLMAFRSLSIC